MAEKEERVRTQARKNFTRSVTSFNLLHNESASIDLVTKAFEKVESCWERLELAQNAFIEVTEIDIETDPKGVVYLDVPEQNYQDVLKSFSAYRKKVLLEEETNLSTLAAAKQTEEDQRKAKEADDAKAALTLKVQLGKGRIRTSNVKVY